MGFERRRWLSYEGRLSLLVLAAALPATLLAAIALFRSTWPAEVRWVGSVLLVLWPALVARSVRERAAWPLQTLANLLSGLREGDFSMRGRGARRGDALGELLLEANALADMLREQRLTALEATSLLRAVLAGIDVAIFVFDSSSRIKLVNRAGERLLGQPAERIVGLAASDLGLADCLRGEPARTLERNFPGAAGRFALLRSVVREGGFPHQLLVVTNLSSALREEERSAWQRLIRVLGHELNNSLTPIKSIAGSLVRRMQGASELAPESRDDMRRGLAVIAERADSLSRFLEGYARLARLPAPNVAPIAVAPFLHSVVRLETRLAVQLVGGPPATITADADQLQQLLINLIRNAVDAALERDGGVRVWWRDEGGELRVGVEDDGPGLGNPANLFVPFFTTKPGGSGIGLVLCRQIAEAHGGSVALHDRPEGGCVAELRLPSA